MFGALKSLFLKAISADEPSSDIPRDILPDLSGSITSGQYTVDFSTAKKLLVLNKVCVSGACDCIGEYKLNIAYYRTAKGNLIKVVRSLDRKDYGKVLNITKDEQDNLILEYSLHCRYPSCAFLIYVDTNEVKWEPEVI